MSYSRTIVMGRLGRDPECQTINSAKGEMLKARFSLAVDRRTKDDPTDWYNVQAFGKLAEFSQKWLSKGREVLVEGRMEAWRKDGEEVDRWTLVADGIRFAGPAPEAKGDGRRPPEAQTHKGAPAPSSYEDDIPF